LNWYDDGIICLYVTTLVEMKLVYQKLKRNQDTIITYVSICFSMGELILCAITKLYVHM